MTPGITMAITAKGPITTYDEWMDSLSQKQRDHERGELESDMEDGIDDTEEG